MKKRFIILSEPKYAKKYKVIKKPLLKRIMEKLKPKKKKQKKEVKKVEEKVEIKGIDVLLGKALPILILIFLIGVGYYEYIHLSALLHAIPPASLIPAQPKAVNISITQTYLADFGTRISKQLAAVAFVSLKDNASLTVGEPIKPVSGIVYVLADRSYPQTEALTNEVESTLIREGFSVTELRSVNELKFVKKSSLVIVIYDVLPSGLKEWFTPLLNNDVDILYVGANPLSESTGTLFKSITNFWELKGVRIVPASLSSKELNISNIRYTVGHTSLTLYNTIPAFSFKDESGRGRFVLFTGAVGGSNFYNSWKSPSDAASDIEKVVNALYNATFSNQHISKYRLSKGDHAVFFTLPLTEESSYMLIKATAKGKLPSYRVAIVEKDFPGSAYFEEASPILPYSISKKKSVIEFVANPSDMYSFVRVKLLVTNASGNVIDEKDVNKGNILAANQLIDVDYYNPGIDEGGYIFEFDDTDLHKVYAKTFLEVGTLNIRLVPDFKGATIHVYFSVAGRPKVIGKATLTYLKKGKPEASMTFTNVDHIDWELKSYFNGPIPVGKYNFTVTVPGYGTKTFEVVRESSVGISQLMTPQNIAIIIFSVIMYAVGYIMKRHEELPYSIDVPDFAPVEYETIEITAEQLLKAFDLVNDFYKWKNTPLTVNEIKKGIRLVLDKEDLVLNDFNVQIVLEALIKEGKILLIDKYYLKKDWLNEGFTAEQLIIFRRLRDACIDLAIPFKPLSKRLPHTKLTLPWQEFWVYIYAPLQRDAITRDIIKRAVSEENIMPVILFYDTKSLDEFDIVLSDGRVKSSLIKAYVDNDMVYIFTIEEFIKKLKQLKS